jgi:hypothetical protein
MRECDWVATKIQGDNFGVVGNSVGRLAASFLRYSYCGKHAIIHTQKITDIHKGGQSVISDAIDLHPKTEYLHFGAHNVTL